MGKCFTITVVEITKSVVLWGGGVCEKVRRRPHGDGLAQRWWLSVGYYPNHGRGQIV